MYLVFSELHKMAAIIISVFFATLSSTLAANIVTIPMFGKSHYMFVSRLGQELAERGHQVCKFEMRLRTF